MADSQHDREMAQLQQLAAVVQKRDAPDAIAIIAGQMADQQRDD